jgi:hypothetical protein
MSWLDEAQKQIKDKKIQEASETFDLDNDAEMIAVFLKKEFENATAREIARAIDYAKEKIGSSRISKENLLKTVRVKLED